MAGLSLRARDKKTERKCPRAVTAVSRELSGRSLFYTFLCVLSHDYMLKREKIKETNNWKKCRERKHMHLCTSTHKYGAIYIYIYMCMCV